MITSTSKKDTSTRAPTTPTPTGGGDVRGHPTSLPVQGQRPMMGDDHVIIPPPQRPSEAKNQQRPSAFTSFQKAAGEELIKRQKQLDNEQRRQQEDNLHRALLIEHRQRKLEEQILYDAKKKKGRPKNKLPSSKLLKRADSSGSSTTNNSWPTALSGSTTASKLLQEDEEAQLQERSPTTTAGKGKAMKRKHRRASEHKNGGDFDEVEYRWSFPTAKQAVARQAVNESKTVNHKNGSKRARNNKDSVVFSSPSPADSRYREEDDDRYPQAPLPSLVLSSSKVANLYSGNLLSAVVDEAGGAPHMWAQQPSTTTDTRSGVLAPRGSSVYYQRQNNYDAEGNHASPAPPLPTPVRLLVPSAGLLLMDTALVFDPAFTTPRSASKKSRSSLSTNSHQKATIYETLQQQQQQQQQQEEEEDANDHSASFVSVYFSLLRQGGIHRSKEP